MCAGFDYYVNVILVFLLFPSSLVQFLCLKNIRTFLKVCHDKFGLRNSELFDPFDLFDVRDFGKVSRLTCEPQSACGVGCCSVVIRCSCLVIPTD